MPTPPPRWAVRRLLRQLNQASGPEALTPTFRTRSLGSNPQSTGDTSLNLSSEEAQRVMEVRKKKPHQRFSDLRELMEEAQLSADKLLELVQTLQQPADQAFARDMRQSVLASNWFLEPDTTYLRDEVQFRALVDTPSRFTELLSNRVQALAFAQLHHEAAARMAARLLPTCYLETYTEPHLGSHALALWFYRFDQDNWFTYEKVQAACARYLEQGQPHSERLELRLFKGFPSGETLVQGITVPDLPVVVNYEEQKITLWRCALRD